LNQDLSVAIEKGYIGLEDSTRYETLKCWFSLFSTWPFWLRNALKLFKEQEAQEI
jgi:hypothetical protein